jgi:hypothetical protein
MLALALPFWVNPQSAIAQTPDVNCCAIGSFSRGELLLGPNFGQRLGIDGL